MLRQGPCLTVTRRLPLRWDVCAQTRLPDGRRGRLAHQIRQDLWRALQRLRGFAPAVSVERSEGGLLITAGGAVAGAIPPGTQSRITQLLADPALRARWIAGARR